MRAMSIRRWGIFLPLMASVFPLVHRAMSGQWPSIEVWVGTPLLSAALVGAIMAVIRWVTRRSR